MPLKVSYPENPLAVRMAAGQLRERGISDSRVLQVMSVLPRHRFVPGKRSAEAYGDHPVTIGSGQTISQPYMVALMTENLRLRGHEKVLEIGTGSGYQTAVLAELAREVCTIELVEPLARRARNLLTELGYHNIRFCVGDGSGGWPEEAPFDGILVAAAAPRVPGALKAQLSDNGVLVIPVGETRSYQTLTIIRRIGASFVKQDSIGCRFVPLVSEN